MRRLPCHCLQVWLLTLQEADALERSSQLDSRKAGGTAEPAAVAAPAQPVSQTGFVRRRRAPLNAGDLASLAITAGDFEAAVARVQPSVRREGFATTPDVTWADVGSLEEVRCPPACEEGEGIAMLPVTWLLAF